VKTSEALEAPGLSGLLGLARRAGYVVAGAAATRDAVRTGRALLVVIAEDAAPGQAEKVEKLLRHGRVPVRRLATRAALGAAVGQPPLTAVALTDQGFAARILDWLGAGPEEGATLAVQDPRAQ